MLKIKRIAIIFSLFSIIVMLSACQSSTNNDYKTTSTTSTTSINQSTPYADGLYIGDVIPNKEVAKKYADLILKDTLQKNTKDYKVVDVYFNNKKNLWTVHYGIDEMTLGGDISIEISKKNGKVNHIEFGE